MAKTTEFDTQAWLTELGFSGDEVTTLLPKFEPRKAQVAAGHLRQSDYDRLMNEAKTALATKQRELDGKDTQLNQEMAEWATLRQTDSAAATAQQAVVRQLETEKFQLEQAIKTLADQAGVDPATVLPTKGTPPTEPLKPVVPALALDPSTIVTFDKLGPIVGLLLNQGPEVYAITSEHQRLTGKPLPPEDLAAMVAEMPTRAGKKQPADLRAIWEDRYKIPDLRVAATATARSAELKAEYDRGQMDARTTAALPTAHATGTVAPIFQHPTAAGSDGTPKAPGLSEARATQLSRVGRTQRAITALTSGKYRTQATDGGR